jgi:stringent starvation protein B
VTASDLSSRRPYLLRAMHEWMSDNNQTPHIVVDATVEGVVVPGQFVKDGRIVLNVSYSAASAIQIENDGITFQARFGGTPMAVSIPVRAVLGIYGRESGEGMLFGDEDDGAESAPPESDPEPTPDGPGEPPRRSHLKIVK